MQTTVRMKLKTSRKSKAHGHARRDLRKREPKIVENTKTLLALRGLACNATMTSVLRDLVR